MTLSSFISRSYVFADQHPFYSDTNEIKFTLIMIDHRDLMRSVLNIGMNSSDSCFVDCHGNMPSQMRFEFYYIYLITFFVNVAKPTKAPEVHTHSARKSAVQPTTVTGKTYEHHTLLQVSVASCPCLKST